MAKLHGVNSTAIRSLGHDPDSDTLDVEFRKSGSKYRYDGVSAKTAKRLENASSIGRYFVRNVRDNYDFTKLRSGRARNRHSKKTR